MAKYIVKNQEQAAQWAAEARAAAAAAGMAAQRESMAKQQAAHNAALIANHDAKRSRPQSASLGGEVVGASTELPASVRATISKKQADTAKQEYEDYQGSEEARKNQQEANRRALMAAIEKVFSAPGVSNNERVVTRQDIYASADPKAQELKARADYYQGQATAAQNEAITEKNLQELESWSEEDRSNLERYIIEQDMAQSNIFGEPQFDTYNLNPLIGKYGYNKVREMAESLRWSQSQKAAEDTTKFAKEIAEEHPVLGSVASAVTSLVGAVTAPVEYAKEMSRRTGQYSTMNPNNVGTLPNTFGGNVRQTVTENIQGDGSSIMRNLATIGYQGGMSVLDNSLRLLASGGNAGISAAIAASGTFGQGLQQYSEQGATPAQAATLAFVDAGLEYMTEKISDAKMLKFYKGGTKKELIKNALWQTFGVEPLSEEVNLFAGIAAEAAILGKNAATNQKIGELVAGGMSYEEASAEVWKGIWQEAKQTYGVSAISAGGQTAATTLAGNVARDLRLKMAEREAAQQPTAAQEVQQEQPSISPEQRVANAVEAVLGGQTDDTTSVNTNPEAHTPQEQAVIDAYQNSVDGTQKAAPSLSGDAEAYRFTSNNATKSGAVSNNSIQNNGANVNEIPNGTPSVDTSGQSAEGGQLPRGTGAAEANFTGLQQYESLISDDNVQRTRQNDARQEEILKRDPYGRSVTEFAGNVGNSEAISDRDVDTLKHMIQDGLLGHDTQSMTDVHAGAMEKIKTKGAAYVRDEITRAVANGKINEHLIAEAEVLFVQYSNRRGRENDAATMLLNLAQMATQSGRQLNMFKLMRRLTPEGQLMVVRKNVDRAVEKINQSRSKGKQANVTVDENLERNYMSAARDALSDEAAVESTVAKTIEDGMEEDAAKAAETALANIYFGGKPAQVNNQTGVKERNTSMAQNDQSAEIDLRWGYADSEQGNRPDANIQTNDMNERIGQRVADNLTRQAREQSKSVDDVLYSEIMRFANDKAEQGRQKQTGTVKTPNLEAMRDYYRYRPFFQNAWNIARDRVEQAMFSMQEGDPRIPVIEQFLASGDEMLGVENWNPIGALDYANPKSTVRRGAKEAATAAGIRMDNRSTNDAKRARQEMRDVLIENAQNKQAAAQRIAQVAVERMGLDGQAAEAMAADVVRAFYNDLAQQSARRVAQLFGTDRRQQQKVQKTMMDRLAELYNMGAFSDEQYRQAAFDSIFGENSGITIDDNLMENFVNAAGERRDQAADAIYKSAAAQIKPTLGEMWDAWRNLSMLGTAKSFIRNAMGSVAFQPYVRVKQAFGTALESLFVDQQNRTKAIVGVGKNDRALMKWALNDSKTKSTQSMMSYSGTTTDEARSAIQDYRKILPGLLDTGSKGVMGAMEDTDMVFKRSEYAMSMAAFLKSRGYTAEQVQNNQVPQNVMEQGRQIAVREAMKATFNDRNRFSDTIAKFRVKGSNPVSKSLNAIAKGILPFTRTPSNILVRATMDYSPVGIARGFYTIAAKAKSGEATVADGIDLIASGLTGTGAYLLGVALNAGLIPGWKLVGKLEEEEKEAGAREYSIMNTETGEYYDISWLAPGNMPLFVGANIYRAIQNHEERGEMVDGWDIASRVAENMSDVIDPLLELSVMASLKDVIENASYQETFGEMIMSVIANGATNYFTQGFPTIFGQLEQMTEDTKTVTYSNADNMLEKTFQRVVGNATQRIPGIDLYQKERIDAEGNVVQNDGDWIQRGFNAVVNPVNKYTEATGPVWDEKARLNKVLTDKVSSPSIPKKISYTDVNGETHKDHLVTAEEYATMEKVQYQTENTIMEACVKSPVYAAMSDKQKGNVFTLAQEYSREKARHEALNGYEKPSGWMADIDGKEMDTILRKVAQSAITDAIDDGNAQELEQAYDVYKTLPTAQKNDMMLNAGGKVEYFLKAHNAGVDAATFLPLYQQFRDIDAAGGSATEKAQKWAYALEEARKAGTINTAQRNVMREYMTFMQMFPAEATKFNDMVAQGISTKNADLIANIVRNLKPANGKSTVTDHQEAKAIANTGLSDRDKITAIKLYVSDAQDEKLDDMLEAGYTVDDYVKALGLYQ